MGLGNVFLNDLIELKQKGALDGATRVMEIGAQQISDSLMIAPGLAEAYRLFGCTSPPVLTPVGTENFTKSAPSSAPFWSALGFARSAIDVEGDALPRVSQFEPPRYCCASWPGAHPATPLIQRAI